MICFLRNTIHTYHFGIPNRTILSYILCEKPIIYFIFAIRLILNTKTMKKHNFYAGPSILPKFTIKQTADAIIDFAGTGLSIMEVSHRSKEFVAVVDEATALSKSYFTFLITILFCFWVEVPVCSLP